MDGEGRSRKHETTREKYGFRKKSLQERKVRSESSNHNSATSVLEDSLDDMIVVGKGCGYMKSRSYDSALYLHECHSDTALNPKKDDSGQKEIVPSEGLRIGLPAYAAVSNTSFSSAKSQMSNPDALFKKLEEFENELSTKNATIAFLKRKLGKSGENLNCCSTGIETDIIFGLDENYESKLVELKNSVKDRDKRILELTRKLEENIKAKAREVEANRGLSCEVRLLNRQLQSMYELVHSKHWDSGIDPKELAKYKSRVAELEMGLTKQEDLVQELTSAIEAFEKSLDSKERELKNKNQELLDQKNKSTLEIYKLTERIDLLQRNAEFQTDNQEKLLAQTQLQIQDEIVRITNELEERYQKDLKSALDEYHSNFEKISKIPKESVERLLTLCENEKLDIMLLKKEIEEEKSSHGKKILEMREEHDQEMRRLSDVHESKLLFLRTQIESLCEQLKERNSTLEVFENELLLYKTNSSVELLKASSKTDDFSSLKELYNAEIISQKQIHKLEIDVFEEKVKRLSQDILYHARNEELHLQELKSAKAMANTFREKYEQLLSDWEERNNGYLNQIPCEPSVLEMLEVNQIVEKFKGLTATLKDAGRLHEEKVKHLQKLHENEIASYQKEVDLFKSKLVQVSEILVKQTELDIDMKELIKNIEFKHTNALRSMSQTHDSEMRLREKEISDMEKRYLKEINTMKEKQEKELWMLKNKVTELQEDREKIINEFSTFRKNYDPKELASLKNKIEETTVQLLKCQGLLACKEEIEEALKARILELENVIKEKEENCRKELEGILAKHVKVEALLSAKEELAKELEEKVKESDYLLCKSREEATELDENCIKLKAMLSVTESKYRFAVEDKKRIYEEFEQMKNYQENVKKDQKKVDVSEGTDEMEEDHSKEVAQIVRDQDLVITQERERRRNLEVERDQLLNRNRMLEESVNSLNERIEHLTAELANNKGPENDSGIQEPQNMYEDRLPRTFATFACQVSFEPYQNLHTVVQEVDHLAMEPLDYKKRYEKNTFEELEQEKVQKVTLFQDEILSKLNNLEDQFSEGFTKFAPSLFVRDKKIEDKFMSNILELENNYTDWKIKATEKCASMPDFGIKGSSEEINRNVERIRSYVEGFNEKLNLLQAENDFLITESLNHQKHIRDLKSELAEAWTQRLEVEDQLEKVRNENLLLISERDHLDMKNKKVLSLVDEGVPSVISWIKIHEVVENIVEEVVALNASLNDSSPEKNASNIFECARPNLKLMSAWDDLNVKVEKKTRECSDLRLKKKNLEMEIRNLEALYDQNKYNIRNQKAKFRREMKHRGICLPPDFLECDDSTENFEQQYTSTDPQSDYETESHSMVNINEQQLLLLEQDTRETYMETIDKLKEHINNVNERRGLRLKEAASDQIKVLWKEIHRLQEEIKLKDEALKERSDVDKKDVDETELESLKLKFKKEMEEMSKEHEMELEKLRSILAEMRKSGNNSLLIHEIEIKHAKEMEELRMYFEQKCAEVEKHYSEEIFSQQSRKMSNSSSVSESELLNDMYNIDFTSMMATKLEKGRILESCRSIFENEEENCEQKKKKLENFLLDIINSHSEEVNWLHSKYNAHISELEEKHAAEMNRADSELTGFQKDLEIEKQKLDHSTKEKSQKNADENFTNGKKITLEYLQIKDEQRMDFCEMEAKYKREMAMLEESWMDELGECRADLAINKVESKEELGRLQKILRSIGGLQEEMVREKERIAEHYKNLNESVLKKCEEEQSQLIKSHAEQLEILIREHQKEIRTLKEEYQRSSPETCCDDTIKKLELEFRSREKELESELSSMKSTYEDELIELRKCCQDTLQEQVNLAKADAVNSLQHQIQIYIDGDGNEETTPKELIQLGEKIAGKYRREIEELKERHQGEVARIRLEYEDRVNRRCSLSGIQRKKSSGELEKSPEKMDDVTQERDTLKEVVASLRYIIFELLRYVGSCEDELNNTIASEFGKFDETIYKSLKLNSSDLNVTDVSILSNKVHFAPNISEIISQVSDSSLVNTSILVRDELDRCLKQLKNDATSLLALSKKPEDDIQILLKKMEIERISLTEKVKAVEDMQKEMEKEVEETKGKLLQLEERSKEVVCEGFGEAVVQPSRLATLSQLKDKARQMAEQCNEPSNMINFLEDICKEGDRLQEEFRREKNDLQQQVTAADKQLRSTRQFLEEQAAEREIERDEFVREIDQLREALRLRERDNSLHDRINQDNGSELTGSENFEEMTIDTLDAQLKETVARLDEEMEKKADLEKELKAAVDKIWSLREIISELENQVAVTSEREAELQNKLEELEAVVVDHQKTSNEMAVELDSYKNGCHAELTEHVRQLEEELATLRRVAEQSNPEAICQMRANLREIELTLIRKTKDLEQLHVSSTNVSCSSPSEDVSIREHLDATRCTTPDEMHCQEIIVSGLPFEDLDRINEKLVRHNRAEEVALKTIRDLEMQLRNHRKILEELQMERDVLLERVDSYLQENSSLKARLDEQRCNAGILQRQMSAELESQIRRLENDVEKLNEISNQKDKQLRDMTIILEQTTKSLKIRENEAQNKSKEENNLVTALKTDLQLTLKEKSQLEEQLEKMKGTVRKSVQLPVLVDTMLEEKNAEIDRLEKEVTRLSNRRAASSLIQQTVNLDSTGSSKSMKKVQFSEPDSFVDFISPIQMESPSIMRNAFDSYNDLKISNQRPIKPIRYSATPESLSSIGPLHLSPRGGDSRLSASWINQQMSFVPSINISQSQMNQDLLELKKQLNEKTEELRKCENQLSEQSFVESEIDEIRNQLKCTMKAVEEDKQMYKIQFEEMLTTEKKLNLELEGKRNEISEQLITINSLKCNLSETLEELKILKEELKKSESELIKRDEEIRMLRNNAKSLHITVETLKKEVDLKEELQKQLDFERSRLESVLKELKILDEKKVEIEEEFLSLRNEYNENLTTERKSKTKLQAEVTELQNKNSELEEICNLAKIELDSKIKEAKKLSKTSAVELSSLKKENEKLKSDNMSLQKDLESYIVPKRDAETQFETEKVEGFCQTCEDYDLALVPLRKTESTDESEQFRENIEKLKLEISTWEKKMDERELKKGETLTFVALIRTLLSHIIDNLDDHFYELDTCRRKMMECSVDDLADRVQKELVLSAKLDNRLLNSLQTASESNALPLGLEGSEEPVLALECGAGDSTIMIPKEKQNLVNLTVKICELEANLQENVERNRELLSEITNLKSEKEELRKHVEQQQNFIKLLEENLSQERGKLVSEKFRYDEDAKIMELLRINFENGIEKIERLEMDLNSEKQHRLILEKQLKKSESLQKNDWETRVVVELKGQIESEKQKNLSLGITLEKERKKYQELKSQLEQEKIERVSEKDVQRLVASDLALLQEQKENLESQLSNARELLKARHSEILSLKRKISLQEIDIKALAFTNDNQQDSDISMMTEKVQDLERELDFYRKQIHKLTEKPEKVVSALLLLKMKNLNTCVEQHVQESNEMGEALLQLTQETEQMKSLIRKLEESTERNEGKTNEDTLLVDVDIERQAWLDEKEKLNSKLVVLGNDYAVLKEEYSDIVKNNELLKLELKKMSREMDMMKDELALRNENKNGNIAEERLIHLLGKYMRADSYRKALAWQKRYLLVVISGYEDSEEETWAKLNRIGVRKPEGKRRHGCKSKRRSLKGVAMSFVAIFRMKYLVKRWRHGRIAGLSALLGRPNEASNKNELHRPSSSLCLPNGPIDPLMYQTHNFVRPRSQPTSNVLRTPPSRDPGLKSSPLDARRVTECIERFSYIQKNLGLSGRPP